MNLSPDIYKITVGDEPCTDVQVAECEITCKPLVKKPKGSATVKVNAWWFVRSIGLTEPTDCIFYTGVFSSMITITNLVKFIL